MDPTDQNTQEQEQPSCSSALSKRLLELEDDTDAYYSGLLPPEAYQTSKRIKVYDFLATFDKPKGETIVISDSESDDDDRSNAADKMDDDDDRSNATPTLTLLPRNQHDVVSNAADKMDDDDDVEDEVDEVDDDSPTPFSEAIKAIQERAERNEKRGIVEEPPVWIPKRNEKDSVRRRSYISSLQELSLNILAQHSDAIASLDCVNDEFRQRLSNLLCDSRKMNCHFLELLLKGVPTQILLTDCSWLTEKEFTNYFQTHVTSELEVLQLDKCGRIMNEYTLPATLAKSPNSLSKLTILSLTGACHLKDEGLRLLVSSATELRSINLSQCSLLTCASLDILAGSLGSILKELYIDDCIFIDVARILPALKRFKQLQVLSLAGVPTVSDKFIKSYFIARGHNIKDLVLKDCVNLTDASMRVIAKHCPGLRVLDIMNLGKLTDLSIGYLANSCCRLSTLKLCRNPFSDEAISVFLELAGKTLEELSLNSIVKVDLLTATSLAKNGQNLHTLDLSWCQNLSDNELGLIVDSCLSLRSLKLFGCSQLTDMFFKGHSNSGTRIIGLKLSPLFQQFESVSL
ncbi:unnamed protein product [Lathyrus sativus]|nr:unnamed protein product [Lathyrus sativus]